MTRKSGMGLAQRTPLVVSFEPEWLLTYAPDQNRARVALVEDVTGEPRSLGRAFYGVACERSDDLQGPRRFSLIASVLSSRPLVGPSCQRRPCFGRCSVLFRRLAAHTVSVGAVPAAQFLVGRQAARTQLEFAGTGAAAPRGREGLKGCWSASTCQLAIRTLRATAALAGLPLPPQRSLTSR